MRAAFAALLVLGLLVGCSDTPAKPKPGEKTTSLLPAAPKDKEPDEPAPSTSDAKAVEVIDVAIKAHGGADALAKAGSFERSIKGTASRGGIDSPFTAETEFQAPNRFRHVVSLDVGEEKKVHTLVLDGNRCWQLVGGDSPDLDATIVKVLGDQCYVWSVVT